MANNYTMNNWFYQIVPNFDEFLETMAICTHFPSFFMKPEQNIKLNFSLGSEEVDYCQCISSYISSIKWYVKKNSTKLPKKRGDFVGLIVKPEQPGMSPGETALWELWF